MPLIEDHADTRVAIVMHLKARCEIGVAGSVQEAVKMLTLERWDLLLSDIGLPDGTGWDILAAPTVRPPLCAVAMSANSKVDMEHKSLTAGFWRHLQKPLSPAELDMVLEETVSRRAKAQS
ncbi:MAG: response regulator [Cupriavidus sp.]|jgi:DNA-binding NtrC family response regulator|nr:MAG: response regulator [Cupriavidus sp.]